jgi:hypothetical protein
MSGSRIWPRQEGLVIRIRRSKTDQEGKGRQVAIPYGRPRDVPSTRLREWIAAGKMNEGPLFRRIDRHGHLNGRTLHRNLIGSILDPTIYAGHSLRAGLCNHAYINGARELNIMRQTGHQVARHRAKVYPRSRAVSRQPGRETWVVEARREGALLLCRGEDLFSYFPSTIRSWPGEHADHYSRECPVL